MADGIGLYRVEAGVAGVGGGAGDGVALQFFEQAAPPSAEANSIRVYAADNGSGVTVLRTKDSAGAVVTLGAAGAGGYISSVAPTNTIEHTVSGGGELTSTIPVTATVQVTGLGVGVAAPATGLGVINNAGGHQTTAGMFTDTSGKTQWNRLNGGTFWECYSATDTTNTGYRVRVNMNADGSARLGFRDGTGTENTIYKVIGSNTLKISHSFEVSNALTIAGSTTLAALVADNITLTAGATGAVIFQENSAAPGATANQARVYGIDAGGVTELHVRFAGNDRLLARDVAFPTYTQTYATADRTLGAYTADVESGAYTGLDNLQTGSPYAKLTDVNALRVAYENLRAFAEDGIQMLNAHIDDHQTVDL